MSLFDDLVARIEARAAEGRPLTTLRLTRHDYDTLRTDPRTVASLTTTTRKAIPPSFHGIPLEIVA